MQRVLGEVRAGSQTPPIQGESEAQVIPQSRSHACPSAPTLESEPRRFRHLQPLWVIEADGRVRSGRVAPAGDFPELVLGFEVNSHVRSLVRKGLLCTETHVR